MAKLTWHGFLKRHMSSALKKYKNDRSKAMKFLGREWRAYTGAKKNPSSLKPKSKVLRGFKASKTPVKRTAKKAVKKNVIKGRKKYTPSMTYVKPRAEGGFNIYRSSSLGTSLIKAGYVLTLADAKKWMKAQGYTKAILER